MLGHRLRRWANIKPALGQRPVFARQCVSSLSATLLLYNLYSFKAGIANEIVTIYKLLQH